jgi:hypothetical protein
MTSRRMLSIFSLISIFICAGVAYALQPAIRTVFLSKSALQKGNRAQQKPVIDDVIDEVPLPSDAEEQARRESKNRFYNRGGQDLTTMDPAMSVSEIGCGGIQPLLPTEYTPIILIGTVASFQPYLSEDKSYIYTEYAVQVKQYLKKDAGALPIVGDKLIVDRSGGVLRLRDGHVIQYHSSGTGMARPLRTGERLVLFLNRVHDGAILFLGRGFLLQNGKAYAIGESEGWKELIGEIQGVEKNLSQEDEFIQAVMRAIQNPPSPAFYSALDETEKETSNQ